MGETNAEELGRQMNHFEGLMLLNAGLDAGYIAVGTWLGTQSRKQFDKLEERRISFRNGIDLGIVAQGASLLSWAVLLSWLVHKERNA